MHALARGAQLPRSEHRPPLGEQVINLHGLGIDPSSPTVQAASCGLPEALSGHEVSTTASRRRPWTIPAWPRERASLGGGGCSLGWIRV